MRDKRVIISAICAILATVVIISGCVTAKEHFSHGEGYRHKMQWDEAIREYTKAINMYPDYAEAYDARGSAYIFKSDYDKAVADYNIAICLDPKKASYYIGRGSAYSNKGEFELAIDDCNMAIELEPKDTWNYWHLGKTYFKKGDYDSAIDNYLDGLDVEWNNVFEMTEQGKTRNSKMGVGLIFGSIGDAYYHKGKYDLAIEACTGAIDLDPNNIWIYNTYATRGEAFQKKGEYIKAEADFQRAKDLGWVP